MAETIALDIGSHCIKLVGLKMTSRGPFLTHVAIREIPYGGGREDSNFVSEMIKSLFREAGLKPGKVKLTISGSGVNVRKITVPSMPRKELKEAIRWEMKGHILFPIESAEIDFRVIEEFSEDGVQKLNLIAVACPRDLIDRATSIAKGAGLEPTQLTVGPFPLWNVLLSLDQLKQEEVVALIDLGAGKTGIHIFKDRSLQISREVSPGGSDFTRAVMEGIESGESPDLLYERSEQIKKEMGTSTKASFERVSDKSVNLSKIVFLLRPLLEKLAGEIGRSLEYYKHQSGAQRIDRILLTGGGAHLIDIDSYLSDELHYPVQSFNPFGEMPIDGKRMDVNGVYALDQIGAALTAAIGMALPEDHPIDLLPVKQSYWPKVRDEKLILLLSLPTIFIVFFLIFWHLNTDATKIKKERDARVAKAKTVDMLQLKTKQLKDKSDKIKQRLSGFPSSMVSPVPFPNLLKGIGQVLPENATLTLVSVQDKGKPLKEGSQPGEGKELQIHGLAFGQDLQCLTAIARMMEGIEKSSFFKNVKLVSAEEDRLYNHPATRFEIVCDIKRVI